MRIILSPAKKMHTDDDGGVSFRDLPVFLSEAEVIRDWLKEKSFAELKKLWACNDKIAEQNIERLTAMNLHSDLTPAVLAYDGIAYQYMAPAVFETQMLEYVQEHLRILSGFYGVLRPLDGVTPYRLEMQAKAKVNGTKDLYEFWSSRLYEQVIDDSGIIINLASKEYSKCIEKYLQPTDRFITCTFAEEEKDELDQTSEPAEKPSGRSYQSKGVYCKMARGEMVRFMAENRIEDPEEMKTFRGLGYQYHEELSSEHEYVFLREKKF